MSDDPGSTPLEIDVRRLGGPWTQALPQAEAVARRALAVTLRRAAWPGGEPLEICLVLADDATLQELNRTYRGRDVPTNVLAFPSWVPGNWQPPGQAVMLGDVVIAWETLCREARAQDRSRMHHFCHLVVHGALHLFGYDHQGATEAEAMERLEREILGELGFPDPYQADSAASGTVGARAALGSG